MSGDASSGSGAASPAFIVIGEAIVDLIAGPDEGTYVARPGGGPLNIAVGLARLGQPAAFAGRLSADPLGTVLRRHLDRSGVDCRYLRIASQPTTISLADLVAGVAAYEFSAGGPDFLWSAAELEFLPAGARVVHFGSLASWLPPGDAAIDAAVGRIRAAGGVLVSYDPNVRPALQPDQTAARAQVERAVGHAHLVKASVEDLQWLYGGADPAAVARRWFGLGAGLVVITAGPDGASCWTRSGVAVSRRPTRPRWSTRSGPATPFSAACSTRWIAAACSTRPGCWPDWTPAPWFRCWIRPAWWRGSPASGRAPTRPGAASSPRRGPGEAGTATGRPRAAGPARPAIRSYVHFTAHGGWNWSRWLGPRQQPDCGAG